MICGIHAVREALLAGQPIERIHAAREARSAGVREILELARERHVPVRQEQRPVLDRLAEGGVHQGVVAITSSAAYAPFEALFARPGPPCVVVLDGVEDPHNLGAVLRTAEASGASGVVVPERHSAPLSATVVKASAGASAHIPLVRVVNVVSALEELKKRGVWVAGLDAGARRLWTEFDCTGPVALVLGGEHKGIRRLVRQHCDVLLRLPMLGKIASVNVSVAAAVMLYEVVRQRGKGNADFGMRISDSKEGKG